MTSVYRDLENATLITDNLQKKKEKDQSFQYLGMTKTYIQKRRKTQAYIIPISNLDLNRDEKYIEYTSHNLKGKVKEHKKNIDKGKISTAPVLGHQST